MYQRRTYSTKCTTRQVEHGIGSICGLVQAAIQEIVVLSIVSIELRNRSFFIILVIILSFYTLPYTYVRHPCFILGYAMTPYKLSYYYNYVKHIEV